MPIADRQVSPEPSKPFSFRMPLTPADYLDRSPLLDFRGTQRHNFVAPADSPTLSGV
jgi:hypothetical protein